MPVSWDDAYAGVGLVRVWFALMEALAWTAAIGERERIRPRTETRH